MKMVLKEEGLNREELKTTSSYHQHRSLLMGTKMDVTSQSQAPVTQVNNVWYNQKCEGYVIYIPVLL